VWWSAKDVIRKELEELARAVRKIARGFCPSKLPSRLRVNGASRVNVSGTSWREERGMQKTHIKGRAQWEPCLSTTVSIP